MFHATKPPATTYARRKSRAKQQDHSEITNNQSSPLEELPPDAQDITLTEMSRRMKKRSRIVLSASQESTERAVAEPVLKKSRSTPSSHHEAVRKSHTASPAIASESLLLTFETDQVDDSIFTTPDLPVRKMIVPGEVEPSTIQDPLSPIPIARRMLSRTSSRNLKENSRRNLASPFHSRPGSRPSSPYHTRQPNRTAAHAKTRTLSTDLKKKSGLADKTGLIGRSSIPNTTCDASAPASLSHTTHHARTTSIPAITASVLDGIAPEDWLVPPTALSRSPSVALLDDLELDTFQAEHPSFYFDAPVKASTPPRKRSATVTQASYKTQLQAPFGIAPTAQEAHPSDNDRMVMDEDDASKRQSRRRRRTMIHMSSDSIFSSALDFSAYQTGDSLTKQLHTESDTAATATGAVSTPFVASGAIAPTLDPAFSPFQAAILPMEDVTITAAGQIEQLHLATPNTSIYPPFPLRRSYSQPIPSPLHLNIQNLQDAFNDMKLHSWSFLIAAHTFAVPDRFVCLSQPSSRNRATLVPRRTLCLYLRNQLYVMATPLSTPDPIKPTGVDVATQLEHPTLHRYLRRLSYHQRSRPKRVITVQRTRHLTLNPRLYSQHPYPSAPDQAQSLN